MIKEKEFRKKIGFEPHEAQLRILESSSSDKCICAGRRFGKSAVCAYEALRTLIEKDKEVLLKKSLPAKASGKKTLSRVALAVTGPLATPLIC